MERKIILYIATSIDGYIAGPDDDISFLDAVEQTGEDYGYHDFYSTVDTVIMGRKTYDKVVGLGHPDPHPDKMLFIISRTINSSSTHKVYYNGPVESLVAQLKTNKGKNIFIDGGSQIVNLLLSQDLIDEYYISIIPVILGKGISLFKASDFSRSLKLAEVKRYPSGLVQLHYVRP